MGEILGIGCGGDIGNRVVREILGVRVGEILGRGW